MARNQLTPHHHQKRIEKLQVMLEQLNISTYLVIKPKNIFYLTGFSFIPTERPIILIIHQGEPYFFVPALEVEHANAQVPFIKETFSYFEYPDKTHPITHLAQAMRKEIKVDFTKMAAEAPGAPEYWGYQGPKFEEAFKTTVKIFPQLVMNMRIIKEPEEIDLIRESSFWAARAHQYLQNFTTEGKDEIEISIRASLEASKEMRRAFGPDYHPKGWGMFPAMAGYRGQIGPHSAYPHAMSQGLTFKKGDVVVTGATANVYGYHTELERTMFIGEPDNQKKAFFSAMLEAQSSVLEAIKPGLKCSDVDAIARKIIKERGYENFLRHHTGHALGLEGHKRPFLDTGDHTVLKPGMVFSCEPGIYIKDVGGFRHSDTFVVTEDGIEVLTQYPRDLSSLIIEC